MIRSFAHPERERLFRREHVRPVPAELLRAMLRKLALVDAAEQLEDLRVPPGSRLEKLRGDRAGQHSIRKTDPWRMCVRWREGDAFDVGIVEYH